tara:strand:+ start:19365 stop:20384 length:1020 start_codon:yes stop_codon:yes gene_type:complete
MKLETKTDLENLIYNQVEENLNLDYKSADSLGKSVGKKKEISKDVSAFANSNGGMIIYGIKEFDETENRHLPEKIDPVNRLEFSKEWLEQVINSNISPRIEGILITSISLSENSNEVAYIVQIQKCNTAHQASDLRYYKRFNFESVAMYDYEIKDIMNRNKTPKFELIMEVEKLKYEEKPSVPQTGLLMNRVAAPSKVHSVLNTLNVYGKNIGGVYANYVNCFLEIPITVLNEKEYEYRSSIIRDGIEYKRLFCDNTIREIKDFKNFGHFNTTNYWPSRYDPILPETRLRFEEIKFKENINFGNEKIFWELYADNAEKLIGEISISELKIIEKEQSKSS